MDLGNINLNSLDVGERLSKPTKMEDEIFERRIGKVTGSSFGKLVVKSKDKTGYILSNSEVARNLIYKVVWERLSKRGIMTNGLDRINFSSVATSHGHDFEQEAIQKYMELTGNEVDHKQKFIEHDDYIGGTPDGYIGVDGLIEVKCPFNGGNHIKTLIERKIYNPEYVYQVQGYLWMTGRKWCDFITYDPDIEEALQLCVIRIDRDEEIIQGIANVMEQVKASIEELMQNELFKQYQ